MPPTIHKTFTNLDNMMFSLDFLSLDTTSLQIGFKRAFDSPTQNRTRNLDIIESGSSVMNLLNFLFILSLILVFHLVIIIIKIILLSFTNDSQWLKICNKINEFMVFTLYMILIKITYMLLLFVSFYEIHLWCKGAEGRTASRIFALFLATFCVATFIFVTVVWYLTSDNRTTEERKKCKWRVLFSGLKDHKIYKLNAVIFFGRRLLIATVVFLLADSTFMSKLAMLLGLQITYMAIIMTIQPFEDVKDLIIDMVNEVFYTTLLTMLFFLNDSNDWRKSTMYIYISLILLNFLIIFIISLSK